MTIKLNWDASVSIFAVSPPKIGMLLGFIVYPVCLNEDEDDVRKKTMQDVDVVISLSGRICGL